MAIVNQSYKIYYIAKGYKSGLTDVKMVVYKPDGVKLGVYNLTEVNGGDGNGIYQYDFEDSDIPGSYLFVINSVSCPWKDAKSVYFENQSSTLPALEEKIDSILSLSIKINDMTSGRWKILNNQMIFYKEDNITEVARYNLFDQNGRPNTEVVFERKKV